MSDAAHYHDQKATEFLAQYQSNPDFLDRLRVWTSLLAPLLGPNVSTLDLGCGGGTLSHWMAERGARVTGVDGAPAMIAEAKQYLGSTTNAPVFFCQTLPSPISGAPFDVVFSSSFLEYLDDTIEIDQWLAALVKPGGILAFSLPNRASVYRYWERALYALTGRPSYLKHVRRMATLTETIQRFQSKGFVPLEHQYYGHRPLLSRALQIFLSARYTHNLFAVVFRKSA